MMTILTEASHFLTYLSPKQNHVKGYDSNTQGQIRAHLLPWAHPCFSSMPIRTVNIVLANTNRNKRACLRVIKTSMPQGH